MQLSTRYFVESGVTTSLLFCVPMFTTLTYIIPTCFGSYYGRGKTIITTYYNIPMGYIGRKMYGIFCYNNII